MPTQMTKAAQQTYVGEGLAIGCLALGVVAIVSDKMDVEFSFRHAWRNWSHASRFPQVRASAERDDIMRILDSSLGRRGAHLAQWVVTGPEFEPSLRQDWEFDEFREHLAEFSGVGLDGWVDLARTFTGRMQYEHVQRQE